MFVFHPDDRWAITRNGKEVSAGTGDRASVIAGVDQFRSLTHAAVRSDTTGDHTVGELLDRIEDERPPIARVQAPRKIRARAVKRSSAGSTLTSIATSAL